MSAAAPLPGRPGRPSFFVVGAAKAGTTALHTMLAAHPDLFLPPAKETNYFAFAGEKVDFRGPLDAETINRFSVTSAPDYLALFAPARDTQVCGEVCPSYLYVEKAAAGISTFDPAARIVIILRNPADRAFSNYLHLMRDGRETLSFEDALRAEDARRAEGWEWFWQIYSVGLYSRQVQRYLDLFPRDHVRVLLYDDFRRDARGVVDGIFRFVGVDPAALPALPGGEVNASGRPLRRFAGVHRVLLGPNRINTALRRLLPESVRRAAGSALKSAITRPEKLDPAARRALLARYEDDIRALEALTGLDCATWRG